MAGAGLAPIAGLLGVGMSILMGAAAPSETKADPVATLRQLNAHYIRSFVESDAAWYADHLMDDFVCTLSDGRTIDKAEFVRSTADGPGVTDIHVEDVRIRAHGDAALIHGVTHYKRDGVPLATRYTDVWLFRDGRWRVATAQLTRVAKP
jgi:ketosteroid isomerase-like protein